MASHEPPASSSSNGVEAELRQLSDMESELEEIVKKVIHCREHVPDEVKNMFSSLLSSRRPVLPTLAEPRVDPGTQVEACTRLEDQDAFKRIDLIRQKISDNVSAMHTVSKRMNDCISRFDKLDSYSETLHAAFKKRTC